MADTFSSELDISLIEAFSFGPEVSLIDDVLSDSRRGTPPLNEAPEISLIDAFSPWVEDSLAAASFSEVYLVEDFHECFHIQ